VHGLVLHPIRVDIRLPKQVKECLLTLLHSRESMIGYDGFLGRFDLAGGEEIGNDPGAVRTVGVNSVGAEREGFVIGRAF